MRSAEDGDAGAEDEDQEGAPEDEAKENHPSENEQTDTEEEKYPIHQSQSSSLSKQAPRLPPSAAPDQHGPSRPSRTASGRAGLSEQGAGVSDTEFQLIQILAADPSKATPAAKASLSSAGRKLLRQMTHQPPSSNQFTTAFLQSRDS